MMLRHIFRRLRKEALYSVINAFSLSIGIALLMLGILYWQNEHSFDQFHAGNPNIFRITTTSREHKGDQPEINGGTGQVQGPAFRAAIPDLRGYTRVLGGGITGDVHGGDKLLRSRLLFADSNFFSLFSFPLLSGNPQTALSQINSVVITEGMAMKFFHTTDVVGRSLQLAADPSAKQLGRPMIVTGVAAGIPDNSSLQFDLLMPMRFMQLSFEDRSWLNSYLSTFVLLPPGADKQSIIRQFNLVFASQAREQIAENIKTYGFNPVVTYGLQPVTDIHLQPLHMSMESGVSGGSDPLYSRLFLAIGFFVLLMAAINFINISIAGSLKRAKEIGVRKISGGSRLQILWQFLAESAVLCFFAFSMAVFFVLFALPVFNRLTEKNIRLPDLLAGSFPAWGLLIFPLVVVSAALYPGWIVSRFSPKEVLYQRQKLSSGHALGNVLVILQFSLATFLIIASTVYYKQMQFIKAKGPGYNAGDVIQTSIEGDRDVQPLFSLIRNELRKNPGIRAVSLTGGESVYPVRMLAREVAAVHKVIDENYLPLMEIPVKEGRNFSPAFPTDSSRAVLVNEAFVRAAGLTKPIGTQLKTDEYFDREPKTIVGVVKDFHTGSFREPIRPMVLFMNKWYAHDIIIRIAGAKKKEALTALASALKMTMPDAVPDVRFLDENNANQYAKEERWQQIIGWATLLAIVICCLGLFGLAHLSARQRIKEIGIRKTLGASAGQIAALLSAGFLRLVFVAIFIALPAGALVMNRWLDGFAYRIDAGAAVFLFSGMLAVLIALFTVGGQSLRAGRINPIRSLRSE